MIGSDSDNSVKWAATWQNNKVTMRPAKTQISLGIRPVWSESSLCTQRVAKDPSYLHADSEDSDQTGRMPRLICVFAGRTFTLFVFSCRGSNGFAQWSLFFFFFKRKSLKNKLHSDLVTYWTNIKGEDSYMYAGMYDWLVIVNILRRQVLEITDLILLVVSWPTSLPAFFNATSGVG